MVAAVQIGVFMNVVVIRGRLSGEPVVRTLASGSQLLSIEVIATGDGGASSVPVAWFDPPPSISFVAGDEVVVRGSVRRRFFRSGGATQTRTEVVAADIVAVSRRRPALRLLARATEEIAGGDDVSRAS